MSQRVQHDVYRKCVACAAAVRRPSRWDQRRLLHLRAHRVQSGCTASSVGVPRPVRRFSFQCSGTRDTFARILFSPAESATGWHDFDSFQRIPRRII